MPTPSTKSRRQGKQLSDPTPSRKAWIGKLMPVHTEMQEPLHGDFIERIYKASGFTPPQS